MREKDKISMKKSFIVLPLIFFTACISLTKDEAKYENSFKIDIAKNNEVVFSEIKKQLPIIIKKHNL